MLGVFVRHATPRVTPSLGPSTAVGRHIATLSAESPILKRLELELGGNTPIAILADATTATILWRPLLLAGTSMLNADCMVVDLAFRG